jgi:hypothetical protein
LEESSWPDEVPSDVSTQVVPIDDEDGRESVADHPPPLPNLKTDAERFDAFRRWLKAGGVSFDVWADKSALLRVAPPLLRVAFPSPFASSQAQLRQDSSRVRLGLGAYFPGCTRAEAQVRPQKEGFESWEEKEAADRESRRESLRGRLECNPKVVAVLDVLGGHLSAVFLEDDPEGGR